MGGGGGEAGEAGAGRGKGKQVRCALRTSLRSSSPSCAAAAFPSASHSERQCATHAASCGRASRAAAPASMRLCRAASSQRPCHAPQPRIRPAFWIRPIALPASASTLLSRSVASRAAASAPAVPRSSSRNCSSAARCASAAAASWRACSSRIDSMVCATRHARVSARWWAGRHRALASGHRAMGIGH